MDQTDYRVDKLHIPAGINYECSGCGQCCLGWPVPLTADDFEKLSSLSRQESGGNSALLCQSWSNPEAKNRLFTHSLRKDNSGRCQFLQEDNYCSIHLTYGASLKPAMCQLFPYTFSQAPDGVYATVNFVSTAALFNSGKPLLEQESLLQQKLKLFNSLFPEVAPEWNNITLLDGFPLSWDNYKLIDSSLLKLTTPGNLRRADRALASCSRYLAGQLPQGAILERIPPSHIRPKIADQLLVKRLFELYMTDDPYACSSGDLYIDALTTDLSAPPPAVQLTAADTLYNYSQLFSFHLGELDSFSEDLLLRYVYSRIFAKMYFGPNFFNMSVLAGVHFLLVLVSLIRLKIKTLCITQQRQNLDGKEIAEIVRAVERRSTQISFSAEQAKVLELILTSSERAQRILSLSA